ncbi:MAG TPA: response regulator [Steroidobacteraceae bacterium]|nr:response regulator [Steroidobacteraceae bacterium]
MLIVDHDMRSCVSLKLMFLDLGYRSTRTTYTANRALALINGFSPTLVLLELDLPDMSVYRLAQLMRMYAQTIVCRFRLIAMVGREAHASGELVRAAGFDGYLAKPIRPPALDHVLQSLRL